MKLGQKTTSRHKASRNGGLLLDCTLNSNHPKQSDLMSYNVWCFLPSSVKGGISKDLSNMSDSQHVSVVPLDTRGLWVV